MIIMTDLRQKTSEIKNLLNILESQINQITPEKFEENLRISLEMKKKVDKLSSELAQKYGLKNLAKYDPEMMIKAKLIEKSFDNIIENFRKELKKTENQIFLLNREKKITTYIR